MLQPTERAITILTGLVVSIFFVSSSVVAVFYASGTFDDVYELTARFDAAGQGLIKESDVKVRGVNIGEVKSVELGETGHAVVTLRIQGDERVPANARAVVRPKTLFGEKFVAIETTPEAEAGGPYLGDGDEIRDTVGSFELEEVLVGAQELLDAVEPADLAVIVDTLAEASRGEGERIRRQIQNWRQVADVFAEHDADTRQFLADFEVLTGAFARAGDDVAALARNVNEVLPQLNARAAKVDDFLDDVADVSRDLADVFQMVQPTLEKMVTEGGKTIAVVHELRGQVPELVVSLRDFAQVLAQAGAYQGNFFSYSGGGKAAAIKLVAGVDSLVFLACSLSETSPACTLGKALPGVSGGGVGASTSAGPGHIVGGPPVTDGVDAVVDVLGQTLAGIPYAAVVQQGAGGAR